jgi:copper chaperone CopZ
MKKLILTLIVAVLSLTAAQAQQKSNVETIDIQMPRFCCPSLTPIIEKCLAFERGVKEFSVNEEDKYVTVTFNTKKTNQEKIEKALAAIGVETPNCKANVKAVDKLPACCQAAAKGERDGCDHSKM